MWAVAEVGEGGGSDAYMSCECVCEQMKNMRRLLNDLLLGHMLNISTLRHWEICNNINVFAPAGSLDTSQVQ